MNFFNQTQTQKARLLSLGVAVLVTALSVATTAQAATVAKPTLTVDEQAFLTVGSTSAPALIMSDGAGIPYQLECETICIVKVSGSVVASRGARPITVAVEGRDEWSIVNRDTLKDSLAITGPEAYRLNDLAGCQSPYTITSARVLPLIGCEKPADGDPEDPPNSATTTSYRSDDGAYSFALKAEVTWLADPATGTWRRNELINLTGCSKFSGMPGFLSVPKRCS